AGRAPRPRLGSCPPATPTRAGRSRRRAGETARLRPAPTCFLMETGTRRLLWMKPSPPTVRPARALAGSAVAPVLRPSALLPGLAHAQVASPPSAPAAIQVPPGNVLFLLGHATGTQNYACQPSSSAPAGYEWTLVAPAATLVDDEGTPILAHFAGPS